MSVLVCKDRHVDPHSIYRTYVYAWKAWGIYLFFKYFFLIISNFPHCGFIKGLLLLFLFAGWISCRWKSPSCDCCSAQIWKFVKSWKQRCFATQKTANYRVATPWEVAVCPWTYRAVRLSSFGKLTWDILILKISWPFQTDSLPRNEM